MSEETDLERKLLAESCRTVARNHFAIGQLPGQLLYQAANEIDRLNACISETVTRADLAEAELRAAREMYARESSSPETYTNPCMDCGALEGESHEPSCPEWRDPLYVGDELDAMAEEIDAAEELRHQSCTQQNEGSRVVPFEPTEDQWGELARDILMWTNLTFKDGHTAETLRYHLEAVGRPIPEWLHDELRDKGHLPKGTIVTLIYKAMVDAAPREQFQVRDHHDALSQAVRDFITVFEGRHYGRMPDEVATALENMKCLAAGNKGADRG